MQVFHIVRNLFPDDRSRARRRAAADLYRVDATAAVKVGAGDLLPHRGQRMVGGHDEVEGVIPISG
jgi:hypothetical protein